MSAQHLPLSGTCVVEIGHSLSAPYAANILARLGARVIKVERPVVGDFARAYDQRARGESSHFVWVNRSKESLALDLKDPHDLAVLEKLIGQGHHFNIEFQTKEFAPIGDAIKPI
jgi:crotonobetainyl-CoA:carnitine CoA-transferase CaiB-like acyl-CoA transferase